MSYAKNGLRAFGLCLVLALGLMAFSAAGAQAQTGWLVAGKFITATQPFHAVIHPLADGKKHAVLLGTVLTKEVEILCGTLTTDDGLILSGEAAEATGTLLFTECVTFLNKAESTVCKPKEPIEAGGKAKAILHNSLTYILFSPPAGKPFATIFFPNELCGVWNETGWPVAGSLVAECLNEKLQTMTEDPEKRDLCLTDLVHHLLKEAPTQSLFGTDGLTFAGNPAKLDGIADALLSAPNLGSTWAVHI